MVKASNQINKQLNSKTPKMFIILKRPQTFKIFKILNLFEKLAEGIWTKTDLLSLNSYFTEVFWWGKCSESTQLLMAKDQRGMGYSLNFVDAQLHD